MVIYKYLVTFIIFFSIAFSKKKSVDEDWSIIFNKAKYYEATTTITVQAQS